MTKRFDPELDDRSSDPGFDLIQGLKILVIVISLMAIITFICVWIARP